MLQLLPLDIWLHITSLLTPFEIQTLRLVDRSLHSQLSADAIWRPILISVYHNVDDMPDFEETTGFCQLFRAKTIEAEDLIRTVRDMSRSLDSSFIMDKGKMIIEMGYDAVPVLNSLRSNKVNLPLRYLSSFLLNSIRHQQFLSRYSQFKFDRHDTESFFLLMSYLDPAFDNLLPLRNVVLDKVVKRVKEHPLWEESRPNSFKVNIIVNALFNTISAITINKPDYTYEDHSILRVYAGEVGGITWIQFAIVQKIANHFNIKTFLSSSFLVIEDSNFHNGVSLLSIKNNAPRIMSMNHLVRVLNTGSNSVQLTRLVTPLNYNSLIELFKIDVESTYSKLHTGMCSQAYAELYPISKQHFPSGLIPFPNLQASLEQGSMSVWPLVSHSFQLNPFNLHCFPAIPTSKSRLIINNYFNPLQLHPIDRANLEHRPKFSVGDVVKHVRNQTVGIVVSFSRDEEWYYRVIPDINEFLVREESLEMIDGNDFKDLIINHPIIGRFFKRFNEETGKFTPKKELLEIYPNF